MLRRSLFIRACLCILNLGCAGQSNQNVATAGTTFCLPPAELWSPMFRDLIYTHNFDKHTRNKVANKLIPGAGVVFLVIHSSHFCGTWPCTNPCLKRGRTTLRGSKKKQIAVWLGSRPPTHPGLRFRHHCGPKFHDVHVRIKHKLPGLAGGVSSFCPREGGRPASVAETPCVMCLRVLCGVPVIGSGFDCDLSCRSRLPTNLAVDGYARGWVLFFFGRQKSP